MDHKQIIKKVCFWSVFSFFYYLGFTNIFKMLNDTSQQNVNAEFYAIVYIALIAHLINKYEEVSPRLCTWFVSLIGLGGFTFLALLRLDKTFDIMYSPFYLFLYIALPVTYELINLIITKGNSQK